jgi:hypothetical protein
MATTATPTTTGIATQEIEYKRLRSYLNPAIKGKNTDAVLNALASASSSYLINNIRAVNDQLYIATASGQYLADRLAQYGITSPSNLGLSDDVFRQIGIQVKNRKQVRDLINNLLDAIFGDELVRAQNDSTAYEPYNLQDGDTLILNFDSLQSNATITFAASQFGSIAAATAQEVADSITKSLRNQGLTGTAVANNNGNGNYVEILSDTIGPASSVTVFGGRAQNELRFAASVAAGGNASTQWTLSLRPGGVVRFTWTGGANPNLGYISIGNYVNIYGGGFTSSDNEGTFTITDAIGGVAGEAYFEVSNPLGTSGIVTQGTDSAILFYNPARKTIASQKTYAAVYQVENRLLEIFLPAATKVIRRDRIGSAHIHDPTDPLSLLPDQQGPYAYDLSQAFTISAIGTTLAQQVNANSTKVIAVNDSTSFPDATGYIVLGYGTQRQEGPIPYIARPSDNTLLISPAYNIQNVHPTGEDVAYVYKSPVTVAQDGTDYAFYLTGVVDGRTYAQDLINSIAATGINVVFTVLYPGDIGLGKAGTVFSEISTIWGE